MFDSIGNPEATDVYKREGDIVASIAFRVRYFQTMPSAFGPRMRTSAIETHMDQLLINGELDSRHMDAYRSLKQMRKGSMEWQTLGFSFSNYLTELDPMSPDFMYFFINTQQQIMSPEHKHRDDLFRFHILLEEFLLSYAQGAVADDQPLIVKPSELRQIDFSKTTLPPQRIQWMRNNLGFTATRDAIL